jgi:surface protein
MGFTTGMTTSTVNQNELINGGAMYPTDNGRRTKGTLKTIVRLQKNDMLVPFAQTRGYYIEPEGSRTETSVIIDPVFYQADANINLRIRAVAPYLTQKTKLKYDMNSLFDVNLNLGNFNNQEQKISEFIENIQKAFNLSFQQDGTNIILNKNKLDKELTAPVDIDTKVNTMDATYTAIDFPKAIEVKWSIDTDEEGFYRSVEDNTTEEQMQSNNWKDYGDYGYEKVNVSNADDATDLSQSLQFSYNWYRPFTLANKVTNNDPITPEPDDTGTTSTHIVVTFTGKITKQSTDGDYGCDTNGDGIDDLYKPHSIVIESYVNYQISGVNIIPDDLKIEVESQKYHIGYEDKGYSAYTPTEMSGELRAPIPDTRINDQICNMIEQPTRIIGYGAYLEEGSEYTIEVIDNVEYSGFEELSTFALTRATAPCSEELSFAYNGEGDLISNINGEEYLSRTSPDTLFIGDVIRTDDYGNPYKPLNIWGGDAERITEIYSYPCIYHTVRNYSYYFQGLTKLNTIELGTFDTSNATNFEYMFKECNSLISLDLTNWDTSKVTNMRGMFYHCWALTTLDLSGWDVSNVTDMRGMFESCGSLRTINVTGWDIRNVKKADYIFPFGGGLEKLILGNVNQFQYDWWCQHLTLANISCSVIECNIVDRPYITGCSNVLSLSWVQDSYEDKCYAQFLNKNNIADEYFNAYTTPYYVETDQRYVTSFATLFKRTLNGEYEIYYHHKSPIEVYSLPYNPNITSMKEMFYNCTALTYVNFDCVNTTNVTDMSYMFYNCYEIRELDLSHFDTRKLTNVSHMFEGCMNLTTLDVSSWDVNHIPYESTTDMLSSCSNLRTLKVKEGTEDWWCRVLVGNYTDKDCSIINSVIPDEPVYPDPDEPEPDEPDTPITPDKPEEEDPITPIGNVVYIPVIGKSEWWIEGYKYAEMAQNDGRGFKQRFWFRNKPTDAMLLTQGEQYRITTSSNYKKYDNDTVYLNYNNGVNTLLGRYFNIDVNSASDEVEIEVYLTPMEYRLISQGASVHFDDNIYKVLEIQGYDPSGTNPTKLKLISM